MATAMPTELQEDNVPFPSPAHEAWTRAHIHLDDIPPGLTEQPVFLRWRDQASKLLAELAEAAGVDIHEAPWDQPAKWWEGQYHLSDVMASVEDARAELAEALAQANVPAVIAEIRRRAGGNVATPQALADALDFQVRVRSNVPAGGLCYSLWGDRWCIEISESSDQATIAYFIAQIVTEQAFDVLPAAAAEKLYRAVADSLCSQVGGA